ncbi:tellurite resistance TerB family protein [Aestuariivirga sp.]|uniref:tellurite resistance TerB family protein n=1 Tax=Aestuariivirga sp. TaxID=2650926 RepID=UPI00391BA6D5
MFDPQKLLEQFLGGGKTAPGQAQAPSKQGGISPDFVKGFATGGVAGGLAGILLGGKTSKKMAKGAVKLGGTAALASLAYKAYTEWQASKSAAPAPEAPPAMKDITPKPEGTAFLPGPAAERDAMSLAILRAMISAAKADGHIDAEEHRRIFARLDELDLDTEEKAFVIDELRKPLDIDAVVKAATTPELAVEIYAASCLAIDPDDPAEQAYLAMLASRLKLDPGLRTALEAEVRKTVA